MMTTSTLVVPKNVPPVKDRVVLEAPAINVITTDMSELVAPTPNGVEICDVESLTKICKGVVLVSAMVGTTTRPGVFDVQLMDTRYRFPTKVSKVKDVAVWAETFRLPLKSEAVAPS